MTTTARTRKGRRQVPAPKDNQYSLRRALLVGALEDGKAVLALGHLVAFGNRVDRTLFGFLAEEIDRLRVSGLQLRHALVQDVGIPSGVCEGKRHVEGSFRGVTGAEWWHPSLAGFGPSQQ